MADELNYYKDKSFPFNLEGLADIDDIVKKNDLKEISNPIYFNQNKLPTSDGLLSNDIFGITKEERASTFAYINLHGVFLHPLIYKLWGNLDSNIKAIVHGTKSFRINSQGELIEDEEKGSTGIKFLKDNFDKIKIKSTSSSKRDRIIKFIKISGKKCFITKFLVIPAFYRDVNSENGRIGVGDINKLYNSIIIASRSLAEASEYGLTLIHTQTGRLQELLLQVYNYFGSGNPDMKSSGIGMPGKLGIIRRANMTKTTDYSSRLVISAPELKVENLSDLIIDSDHVIVPLASVCTNFFPYIMFWLRRFFDNEFSTRSTYDIIDKNGKIEKIPINDYQIEFSDDRIKKEIDRFVHGHSRRLIPIQVPTQNPKKIVYMKFRGKGINKDKYSNDEIEKFPIQERILTWCDLLYMAAVDVTIDKHVLITRYPIDSFYNQFPCKISVASMIETEPMIVYGTQMAFYRSYPKIREEDIINKIDTSNKFIDTLNMSNTYLGSIGGDYDGDQVSVKGVYSIEANDELAKQLQSKAHYISLDGKSVMAPSKEAIQSLYCLTLTLKENILTNPEF